jgi:hypothetical protein
MRFLVNGKVSAPEAGFGLPQVKQKIEDATRWVVMQLWQKV